VNSNSFIMQQQQGKSSKQKDYFRWVVDDFSLLKDDPQPKYYSPVFRLGGNTWRVLMFPKGNNDRNNLSVYLEVAEQHSLPTGWQRKATFTLVVFNQKDPRNNKTNHVTHRFDSGGADWGFRALIEFHELERGGFLVNDRLIMEVYAQVENETVNTNPTIAKFLPTETTSKQQTSHVGLQNHSDASYLNSLLQMLFHIPYLRQRILQMPCAQQLHHDVAASSSSAATSSSQMTVNINQDEKIGFGSALQRLFYHLQTSNVYVRVEEFLEAFQQSDMVFDQSNIESVHQKLLDKIHQALNNNSSERSCVPELFAIKQEPNYVYSLSLDIENFSNLNESLESFLKENTDIQSSICARKSGSLLSLNLQRFVASKLVNSLDKLNNHFEFESTLNVSSGDENVEYHLYGVFVHRGQVHTGHYYSFLRPFYHSTPPSDDKAGTSSDQADSVDTNRVPSKQWYKFDDERVSLSNERHAIDDNFGEGPEGGSAQSTAYRLVYIRGDELERLMLTPSTNSVPEWLDNSIQKELKDKQKRIDEHYESHLYMELRVAVENNFHQHDHRRFDLLDFDSPGVDVRTFHVRKNTTLEEFKAVAAQAFNIPEPRQRFWEWVKRENGSYRPSIVLAGSSLQRQVCVVHNADRWDLWLESCNLVENSKEELILPKIVPKESLLLFFKYYEPTQDEKPPITYVGSRVIENASSRTVRDLLEICASLVPSDGVNPEALQLYEEVQADRLDRLELYQSLTGQAELQCGDVIVFQKAPNTSARFPNCTDYYHYIHQRIHVEFSPLHKHTGSSQQQHFTLELAKDASYEHVATRIAKHLGISDPLTLRFTGFNPQIEAPRMKAFPYNADMLLENMLQFYYGPLSTKLFYEVLELPITQLEEKKSLTIQYQDEKAHLEDKHYNVFVSKQAAVVEVLDNFCTKFNAATGKTISSKDLTLVEVYHNRITRIHAKNDPVALVNEYASLRAIKPFTISSHLEDNVQLVPVAHYRYDYQTHALSHFSTPFLVALCDKDNISQLSKALLSGQDAKALLSLITPPKPDLLPLVDTKVAHILESSAKKSAHIGIQQKFFFR